MLLLPAFTGNIKAGANSSGGVSLSVEWVGQDDDTSDAHDAVAAGAGVGVGSGEHPIHLDGFPTFEGCL